MVSHYSCAKQDKLRQFNLSNAKQGTDAPSNIQQANVRDLEDRYFQEQLEPFQTRISVYKFNRRYTGTFNFMPAVKIRIYDPLRNRLHNSLAHRKFENNFVS